MSLRHGGRSPGRVGEIASLGGLFGTIVAMVCLSGFAWATISAAGRAGEHMHAATAEAARYDAASAALARVQAAETRYVFTPVASASRELAQARGSLAAAIASLRAHAGDAPTQAAGAQLARDGALLQIGIDRMTTAITRRRADAVVGIEARQVRRPVGDMRRLIKHETAIYHRSATAGLAASRSASARLSIVALITAALGVAVTVAVLRTVRLRRKLGEAHGRELERLRTAALRDSLTGLRNHRSFHEDLRLGIAQGRVGHVLLIDVDGLKETNDDQGHKVGDDLLVKLAATLDGVCAGHGATAYRVGGDEFIVLLGTDAGTDRVAGEIHAACALTDAPAPAATVAVASWQDEMDVEELLRRADLTMGTAKLDGAATRGYSPQLEKGPSRADIERAQLLAVLDTPGAITPVFQPIFDLRSQEIVGYEALSRFPAEVGHSPQEWFDLARRHGLAVELEGAAVRAALRVPGRPAGVSLALNVSPEALLAGGDPLGLPPDLSSITIEVTENALVTEGPDLELVLQDLRARGARIAVDDAGAGYAGFGQLVRVRPDIVKLDRSLVASVNTQPTKAAVIKAFVGFAKDTGALICAEGIETAGELHVVKSLGAATGQGYLLGRPNTEWVPPELLALPVRTHRPSDGDARVITLRPAASA